MTFADGCFRLLDGDKIASLVNLWLYFYHLLRQNYMHQHIRDLLKMHYVSIESLLYFTLSKLDRQSLLIIAVKCDLS